MWSVLAFVRLHHFSGLRTHWREVAGPSPLLSRWIKFCANVCVFLHFHLKTSKLLTPLTCIIAMVIVFAPAVFFLKFAVSDEVLLSGNKPFNMIIGLSGVQISL